MERKEGYYWVKTYINGKSKCSDWVIKYWAAEHEVWLSYGTDIMMYDNEVAEILTTQLLPF